MRYLSYCEIANRIEKSVLNSIAASGWYSIPTIDIAVHSIRNQLKNKLQTYFFNQKY